MCFGYMSLPDSTPQQHAIAIPGYKLSHIVYTFVFSKETRFLRGIMYIQSVPGGRVNILREHDIGHSKQKSVYVHVSNLNRFRDRAI
jgi:hypothetical protein